MDTKLIFSSDKSKLKSFTEDGEKVPDKRKTDWSDLIGLASLTVLNPIELAKITYEIFGRNSYTLERFIQNITEKWIHARRIDEKDRLSAEGFYFIYPEFQNAPTNPRLSLKRTIFRWLPRTHRLKLIEARLRIYARELLVHDFNITVENRSELDSIYSYLDKYFLRYCLFAPTLKVSRFLLRKYYDPLGW